jgi:hypothetical protein
LREPARLTLNRPGEEVHRKTNREQPLAPSAQESAGGTRFDPWFEANFDPFVFEPHPSGCEGCTERPRRGAAFALTARDTREWWYLPLMRRVTATEMRDQESHPITEIRI